MTLPIVVYTSESARLIMALKRNGVDLDQVGNTSLLIYCAELKLIALPIFSLKSAKSFFSQSVGLVIVNTISFLLKKKIVREIF